MPRPAAETSVVIRWYFIIALGRCSVGRPSSYCACTARGLFVAPTRLNKVTFDKFQGSVNLIAIVKIAGRGDQNYERLRDGAATPDFLSHFQFIKLIMHACN